MKELSLDPVNWDIPRTLGNKIIDDVIRYLSGIREQKIWTPISEKVKQDMKAGIPYEASDVDAVYKELMENVYPYPIGNAHPRFWGWVVGSGEIYGALADFFVKGMNLFGGFGEHSAIYIEKQVLEWLKEMVGFPVESSGILVTGSTLANLVGLHVARHARSPFNDRTGGIHQQTRKLIVYCSTETHNSNHRAVEILGLGLENLRIIDVNDDYTMNIEALKRTIEEDRNNGYHPFCVIGTVGTVNTGAIDPIDTLADLCGTENLWLHVDGAFGASLALLPEMKTELKGLELADSIAFDFHKWLHTPYEAGCVLVKDPEVHLDTYLAKADYLEKHEKGVSAGPSFFYLGPEMSRSARALKIWFPFKIHGINRYADLLRQNLNQAKYLAERVAETGELELMAPVPMNIVCFRYIENGLSGSRLNEVNRRIVMELQEQGIAIPSHTILEGNYVIRVAIANHRSRLNDFDVLIEQVVKMGRDFGKII